MASTRPPSNDPADIAAWEEERARLREEREFRSRADQFFGEARARWQGMGEDITAIRSDMAAHEQRDKERFEAVDTKLEGRVSIVEQRIGGKELSVARIVGIGLGVTGVVGLLVGLVALASSLIGKGTP